MANGLLRSHVRSGSSYAVTGLDHELAAGQWVKGSIGLFANNPRGERELPRYCGDGNRFCDGTGRHPKFG